MSYRCPLAACLAVLLFSGSLLPAWAVPDPQVRITGDEVQLLLPESGEDLPLRLVEWSPDLLDWFAVARDYGGAWESVFPLTPPVYADADGSILSDPSPGSDGFFRMESVPVNPLDDWEAASRFLQQATFGPTRELLEAFPGIGQPGFQEAPYVAFETWIEAQMDLPVFSLRAYWRQRSNPDFVDNSAQSPFEVGHDPALGHQLVYNIGQERFYPDTADALAAGRRENDVLFSPQETKQLVWYQAALTAPDALRQRMAWALSQLFVLGESGSNQPQAAEKYLSYYDIFLRHAFGSFRDILSEVTWHPMMGHYLTYINNRKADPRKGTFPDENYAREVMQLFTIGLWMLNPDGTFRLDEAGQLIPTYDNGDIEEFAKVFTGLRAQPNRDNIEIVSRNDIDPMRVQVSWHDFNGKTLLDGSLLGPFPVSEAGARQDVEGLLDHLFQHPNTAPFVARLLIQRLTVSNPSPGYIRAVAESFESGRHGGRGSGQRGDLAAVLKAVLLHPEAREPALAGDSGHGRLREPLIRLLHVARAFGISSLQTYGLLPFDELDKVIAQSPFDSPSVFNFYLPDHQPAGLVQDRGLYAPEFQIHTDITALSLPNAIRHLVYEGVSKDIGKRWYAQAELDLAPVIALGDDASALVDYLDRLLTAGRLAPANREILLSALTEMPGGTASQLDARARRALSLFCLLPEFNVIY